MRITMLRLGLVLFLVGSGLVQANAAISSQLIAQLTASGGMAGDEFGLTVAVCGNMVVVGASELNSTTIGAAYVYVKGPLGWANMTQTAKLIASDGVAGAVFGSSVACYGHTVVVGAPHQYGGEAYVFVEPATGWRDMTETARLGASDEGTIDDFGYAVGIDGKTIVVGAPQASGSFQWQGKSYVFEKPKGGWKTTSAFTAELTSPNPQFDGGFGVGVSISGNALVVGGGAGSSATGAAYVFVEPIGGWMTTSVPNAELRASDAAGGFGYSLSMSGNEIAVGAYETGQAYIFVEPTSGWENSTETAEITADNEGSYFAYSLSLKNNVLVVGSANDPSNTGVFVYVRPASGWETTSKYKQRLTSSDGYGYGFSVAVGGGVIVAGSIGKNSLEGTAYLYAPE